MWEWLLDGGELGEGCFLVEVVGGVWCVVVFGWCWGVGCIGRWWGRYIYFLGYEVWSV